MGILEVAVLFSGCSGFIALHEYVLYKESKEEEEKYDEADQYDE
jgi:hypothetical protein